MRYPIALLVGSLVSGCAVKAGNPGVPPGKYNVTGTVQNMEDGLFIDSPVTIKSHGQKIAETFATQGKFLFTNVNSGRYVLEFPGGVTTTIDVHGNVVRKVLLPRPAMPGKFRAYSSPGKLCLLWEDRSGIESAFRVWGPKIYSLPADSIGITDNRDAVSDFTQTFFLIAENEYGVSISTSATIAAYPPTDLVDRKYCRGHVSTSDFEVIEP